MQEATGATLRPEKSAVHLANRRGCGCMLCRDSAGPGRPNGTGAASRNRARLLSMVGVTGTASSPNKNECDTNVPQPQNKPCEACGMWGQRANGGQFIIVA